MADNFLERRMEDLKVGKPYRKGHSVSLFKRAFVLCGTREVTEREVLRLRSEGWRVAFASTDLDFGKMLAQTSGSQFHPVSICDFDGLERSLRLIWRAWRGLDIVRADIPEGWAEEDYRDNINRLVVEVRGSQPVVCDDGTCIEVVASYGE